MSSDGESGDSQFYDSEAFLDESDDGWSGIDPDLCHYCEAEPDTSKCECCNCWEYDCRTSDPWACSESCECESCSEYRDVFKFPFLLELQAPLTPSTIYDRSTIYELQQFVRDRGLKDPQPSGLTYKHLYYRILRAADENLSFRFSDLPPEMRNHVYRDLLIFPRAGAGQNTACYPAILRASRASNEEGKGILYGENVFQVDITQDHTKSSATKKSVRVHDEYFLVACLHSKFSMLPYAIDSYPPVFKRVQQLNIKVTFICMDAGREWMHGPRSWDFINKCLLSLSSFLMEGHHLKKLTIDFQTVTAEPERGWPEEWEIGHMLYPLRRLRNVKQVEVRGDLPKKMSRTLKSEMQSTTQAPHNTLRHWNLLHTEAIARLLLAQHLHGSDCNCGSCYAPMEDCMLHLQGALAVVDGYDDFREYSCGIESPVHERNIQARLADLQRALRVAKVAELKEKFDAFVKAEKKRRRYDSKVGQEILMDAEKAWGDEDLDDIDGEVEDENEWFVGKGEDGDEDDATK